MDKCSEIQAQIDHFQKELDFVNVSLVSLSEGDPRSQKLCELKLKLEEILELTKNQLLELKKEELYRALDQFEGNLNRNLKDESLDEVKNEPKDDFETLSISLEGKICRAPFRYESGKIEYHNAMIMNVEEVCQDADDIMVKVLFTNPIKVSMKSCAYYLEGRCHFSESKCKYSHGFRVLLSQLAEFVEIDLNKLVKDSKCLVKTNSQDLWCKGIIDQHIDGDHVIVNLMEESRTVLVNIENVIPFDEDHKFESSENVEDVLKHSLNDDEDNDEKPVIAWDKIDFQTAALGEWEAYTKGIGSKLIKKMGYIWGSGLGKSGEGRVEPIEAIVLPAGKSLDYCLQFKEQLSSKAKTRAKIEKSKLVQAAKRYHSPRGNVFNFLNQTLKQEFKKYKTQHEDEIKLKEFKKSLKSSTNVNLNVESFKIGEEIKKAQLDLLKLERGLERNENRDKAVYQNLYSKLKYQKKLIASLRQKEKNIEQEQKTRETHKKLTIF